MAEVTRCALLWASLCFLLCQGAPETGGTANHSKPLHASVQQESLGANRRAAVAAATAPSTVRPQPPPLPPPLKPTSLAGNLLLLLISIVIAGSLFLMLLCFIHKWRENMGASRYPRVVYSMLRQSEDEPEDVLGEILINIGLAAPEDARPLETPSSTDASEDSPQPSEHEVDISDLDGTKFTTIPLKVEEAAKRLMAPEPEESDEELLQ